MTLDEYDSQGKASFVKFPPAAKTIIDKHRKGKASGNEASDVVSEKLKTELNKTGG
jgi:hypothetical protein